MLTRLSFRCFAASGLLPLLTSPVLAIGTTPPSWEPRETVTDTLADYSDHIGADRVLAYDHHGSPGIAFYDDVNGGLRYARRVPGVGWVHTVDTVVDSGSGVGRYPSLAYDRYERPAISYWDGSLNGDLKYAHFNGATWQIETADSTDIVGSYTSLAFDRLGRPAVAYYDTSNSSLKVRLRHRRRLQPVGRDAVDRRQ